MRGEDAVRFNMTSQSGSCPLLFRSSAFTSISSSSGGKRKRMKCEPQNEKSMKLLAQRPALKTTYPKFVDIWSELLSVVESLDWIVWQIACAI